MSILQLFCYVKEEKYAGHNYTDTNAMLGTLDVLKEEEKI